MMILYRSLLLTTLFTAFARSGFASNDRVSIGSDITVGEGETGGDIVCLFCSVKLAGNVQGNVVTVLGDVRVTGSQWITGDVVAIGGNASLAESSSIYGDAVVVAGELQLSPNATVNGDREVFSGRGWLLLPLAPLMILAGILWLIVWLIRRNRYRVPVYPQGNGL